MKDIDELHSEFIEECIERGNPLDRGIGIGVEAGETSVAILLTRKTDRFALPASHALYIGQAMVEAALEAGAVIETDPDKFN